MEDFRDEYVRNAPLKKAALDYAEDQGEAAKFDLLAELAVKIREECEALVPMLKEDEKISYYTVSDGEEEWIPMYTDWDSFMRTPPSEYTMSLPIKCIVEDALESAKAEGIVINLNSEEVFLRKEDLDWVLGML